MRILTPAAQNTVSQHFGAAPITVIGVAWRNDNNITYYADKTIPEARGKIVEVTNLDAIINLSGSSTSQEITVILSDTDGTIKAILDTMDIHKRPVFVYQYFENLDFEADKILLFKGRINSPLTWNEGSRQLRFDIITLLEDNEIGFSPEAGQFENLSPDLVGKPWPMCFGTVMMVRPVRLTTRTLGTLGDGVGFPDFALPLKINALNTIYGYTLPTFQSFVDRGYITQFTTEFACRSPHLRQVEQLRPVAEEQEATRVRQFRVLGGEEFPRGRIQLRIGSAILRGQFDGNVFTLTRTTTVLDPNGNEFPRHFVPERDTQHPNAYQFAKFLPLTVDFTSISTCASLGGTAIEAPTEKVLPFAEVVTPVLQVADRTIALRSYYTGNVHGDLANYVYLSPGSRVELASSEEQKFVVSIVPGEVLRVSAWVQIEGQRFLQDVPSNLYTVTTEQYGDIEAVIVTLPDSLAKLQGEGWEEDIFVTFRSSIGPNTVEIIEYLINRYADLLIDSISFDHVRDRIENYPSHFAIYEQKSLIQVLREIAWQARCAIYLKNDVFFIKYLPEEETPVTDITDDDVLLESLQLGFTDTEDLVTKMSCKWTATDAQEVDSWVILRHNINKYGMQEQEFDFYIYNYADAVIKSATFWLIRLSNTWKILKFQTPLHKFAVETLDTVNIDLDGAAADIPVNAIVTNAAFNSSNNTLIFDCWLPVRSGQMLPYVFAYPADVDSLEQFPTADEIADGQDGTNTDGRNVEGELPERRRIDLTTAGGQLNLEVQDPFNMGRPFDLTYNFDRRLSDKGNPTPSDTGDNSPGEIRINPFGELGPNAPGPETPVEDSHRISEPDGFGGPTQFPGAPPAGPDAAGDSQDGTDVPGEFDPNDLPDPDTITDCKATFRVWNCANVTRVWLESGDGASITPGDVGNVHSCEMTPQNEQEHYAFNSVAAATEFRNQLVNFKNGFNAEVGGAFPHDISPLDVSDFGEPCAEPEEDEQAMIGYRAGDAPTWEGFNEWLIA